MIFSLSLGPLGSPWARPMAIPATTVAANNEQSNQRDRIKAQQDIDVPRFFGRCSHFRLGAKSVGNRMHCGTQEQEQTCTAGTSAQHTRGHAQKPGFSQKPGFFSRAMGTPPKPSLI